MVSRLCAGALLVALAAAEVGCAWGYVTYFHPELKNAREIPHLDPYMRPPPPSAVEVTAGSLAVGSPNIRKFMLLPIPWLRRGFRPVDLQVQLAFSAEPSSVVIDLGAVSATIDGVANRPSHVEYEGRRPAPVHVETVKLPIGGRVRLDSPTLLTFTFGLEAGDADEFRMNLGEIRIDGVRTLLHPLAFEREGDFVVYRSPAKKKAASEDEEDGSGAF